MKSSKADGAKYTQMNGAATPGETGPLFPRLHISETEKAGPRAPPRNKMALFEQFTVPSHRFVQPSRPSTAVSKQKQQFVPNDYRYPYVSYYTPSSVPHSNISHGIASDTQPSHGISSCVTSSSSALVTDHESQRASGSQTGEKSVEVSRATRKEDGSSTLSSWLDRKGKVALNDNVPMQSWPRAQGKDVPGMLYAMSGGSENPNDDKFDSVESAERPIITNIRSGLQEATSTVEAMLACPVVDVRSCGVQERTEVNGNNTGIDDVHLKSVVSKPIAEVFDEQNHGSLLTALGEVCQQPVHGTEVIQPDEALPEDLLRVNELGEGGKNNCLQDSADISMAREVQDRPLSGNSLVDNTQATLAREPPLGLPRGCKDTQKRCCPSDGDKGDSSAGGLSVDSLSKDKDESMGESYVNQIGSNEASELSQHGNGLRGYCDDSPSSVLAAEAIRPTDVIRAVGQQQFWKARKALLRQQRIFSDQVFQLHKLIKVQQLLAETPGTFIDEEMAFGDMDMSAASPSPRDFTQREQYLGEKVHNAGPYFEKSKKCQASERTQPKTAQKPEWFTPVGNDDIGSNPYFPAFSLGGTSAWGYPSVGMGQWMGPIAAPGRPSAYQPFTGTFPPGAPYGGLYTSATLGPISPQFPFGIPYSGQRSEAWEATSSNHDPEAGSNHQAATGVGHTPVNMANDLSGAWHFWHYSNPFYNQRSTASVSEKVVPTGSGASINDHRPAKTVHPSGMHLPEGDASHAGALNTNALEGAARHCEISPPSTPRGSKFKSSSGTPSAPLPKKAGSRHQEVEHPAQNENQSFKQYKSNRAGGGEEVNRMALRWLKHQQDQVILNREHCEETFVDRSPDYSGNALDLFPLVPSLSSDGQDGPKQGREHWQGRVIKAVPHPAVAASQSAAGILLSLQRERQQ